MPLSIVKILSDDDTDDLDTKVAAYKAGAGSDLLDHQRAMATSHFEEVDGDPRTILALAHGGIDTPTATNKTADLQHVLVRATGSEADMQAAVDEALSLVVHQTVTDANLDLVANEISSATAPFTTGGEDDGRKVRIAGELRNIVSVTSTSVAVYDGDPLTGTGQTVEILGAEVVQDMSMTAMKKNAKNEMMLVMACEGELP